ncbi:MAG: cadherin-like domain-containing protein, partial [Ramlibacter sp.]|nr:cadherin-like domain-containing protein [Ramlibacter sp.]
MSLKNITLRINDASDTVQTHQIAGGTGGAGSRGQALRLKALANVKYHFTDEATGFAPENLATKRVGKDLHIAFEGGQVGQPDLVIEDYYQDDGAIGYAEGSDNLLVGTHENGQTYPFVPESAQASDAVSQLAEGIQAGQALGISHAPVPLWWLPLLALPLLGGGGSTPPPDHKPEINGLTPKAQGGDVKVYEKALTTGSDAASPAERGDAAFTIKSQDGVKSLTIGGTEFLKDGAIVTGARLLTPLGNELTVTGYDKATGEVRYSYLLKGSKTHPAGAAENALFEDLQVVLTDNDGDKATAVLSAQIVDDVPTARDDAFTQVQENQALVIDALANDIQGADGVPLAKVAVTQQPVQGTVSYDAATGKFTYTPNPGAGKDSTEDSFRYTITDADGDTSTATVKITLQPDQDIWIVPQDFVTVSEGALPSPAAPVLRMRMLARAVESAEAEGQLVVSYYNDVPQGDLLQSIQLSADGLDAQLQALGQDVVWALSADGLQLTGTSAGTPVLTIALTSAALTDATTGQITYSYKVTLLQPVTHPETPAGKNLVTLKGIAFTVTDADQESKTGTFDVDVQDAVPVALDDVADVQPDVGQAVSGNVLVNDTQGADGARVSAVVASQLGSASQAVGDAAVEVAGQYGTLTISADGSYRYARTDGSAGGVEDVFTYTLTDADLDSVEATLTIRVGNATPTVGEEEPNPQDPDGDPIHVIAAAQVHEAGLPARTGEPAGSDAASDSETTVGQFGFASIDGLKALTLDGVAVQAGTAFPAEPLLENATGQLWAYYTFDAATAQGTVHYQYMLLDNTLTDPSSVAFAVEVTDQDGQSASNTLTVVIVDDAPTAVLDTNSVPSGTYAPIEGNVMANDTEGADGAEVVGVQAGAGDVQEAGTEVPGQYGTLTLNADGSYSYQRDAATTEGGVTDVFTYTIQDGDGDTA